VPPEPQLRGLTVKRRTAYRFSPSNTFLEPGLLQGSDNALTRRDASPGSSGRRDSLWEQGSRSVEGESNPKAGLDKAARRLCSNPAPPHGLVPHKALFGGGEVVRPGTTIAGHRGLAQSATSPPRPATSEGRRATRRSSTSSRGSISPEANLRPRRDSTSSSGAISPERVSSRDSLMPKKKRSLLRPLSPPHADLPSGMAHRRKAAHRNSNRVTA
jgi:hypothetical protein